MDERCVRCGATLQDEGGTGWVDMDGYVICQDWTGHDQDGLYGPSHTPYDEEQEREDGNAYEVHPDDIKCQYCERDRFRQELEMIVGELESSVRHAADMLRRITNECST
jgi:hypothetical protein